MQLFFGAAAALLSVVATVEAANTPCSGRKGASRAARATRSFAMTAL